MKKIAVVYFSGSGNTEKMARAIEAGANKEGEATVFYCTDFDTSKVTNYDAFAFGCPSYGAEELEESEFRPMWDSVKGSLENKAVALFGSYGWGDGEWMESWKDECDGINLVDTYICNEEPDEEALDRCKEIGMTLVK